MKLKLFNHNIINKKRIIIKVILFCLFATSQALYAKDFEGEIKYSITYEDGIDKQILEALPSVSELIIKNQKFKSEAKGNMGSQVLIYDHKKEESFSLIDFLKKPLAIKKNNRHLLADREQFKVLKIKHTVVNKIILGYSCKKIIVSAFIPKMNQHIDFEAFYTISLGNTDWINEADPIYHQVKGLLLDYEIQMGSVMMRMKATKIIQRKVNESEFKIPKSFTIVSPEEAQEVLQSGK